MLARADDGRPRNDAWYVDWQIRHDAPRLGCQDKDAVGQVQCLVHVMRDDQQRGAVSCRKLQQQILQACG